jgi:hypothetical protein
MPFFIEGWIEVARDTDVDDEHAWFGAVALGSLVDVGDRDGEQLFGLSKLCVSGEKAVNSIAAQRGWPANPSSQVRHEMVRIAELEERYGPGEIGGFTYARWGEIRDFPLVDAPSQSQWSLPFALARVLEDQFGVDGVRFVVWYNW